MNCYFDPDPGSENSPNESGSEENNYNLNFFLRKLIKIKNIKILNDNFTKNLENVQIKEYVLIFAKTGFCTFTSYVLDPDPDLYISIRIWIRITACSSVTYGLNCRIYY